MPIKRPNRTRLRVMLIEDDPDDVFLFQRALQAVRLTPKRDIALEFVDNGFDALHLVSNRELQGRLPDVLVLDLNIPRLDGVKFLAIVRKYFEISDVPVFVLTTSTEIAVHQAATRAGANKVFVKPDSAAALQSIAQEIVELGVLCAKTASSESSP